MGPERDYTPTKEDIDAAVRKALEVNSKSGVMFILRERVFREIIEEVTPYLTQPLIDRIYELESRDVAKESPPAEGDTTPRKSPDARLMRLRETLEDMVELTEE